MAEEQTSYSARKLWLRAIFLLTLALVLITGLGGCRYSEALANIINDNTAALEPDATPEYVEAPNAQQNSELNSTDENSSDNLAVQEQSLPVYDANAPENGYAKKRIYDPTSDNTLPPTEGEDPEPEVEEEPTAIPDETTTEDAVEGMAPAEDEGIEQQAPEGPPKEPAPVGRGGTGQTYGEDGSYEDLPDASSIAATGQYALIVQMLAGKGALAAADEQWLSDIRQTQAFTDEGLESVPAVWGGDGSAAGSLNADALIATTADVVLVNEAVDMSEAQKAQLTEAGINVVQVPLLGRADTTDADIQTAVRVVGQLLASSKSNGEYNASAMATKWQEMHNTTITSSVQANGGYSQKVLAGVEYTGVYQPKLTGGQSDVRISTAFIDSWVATSGASIKADRSWGLLSMYLHGQVIDISDGVGVSASVSKGSFALIDYYLQTAGVVNNAYDGARPISTNDGKQTLPYAVVAGDATGLTSTPLGSRNYPSALWFGMWGASSEDIWYTIGDTDFPGLVAATEDIANKVVTSANKVNSLCTKLGCRTQFHAGAKG